jgi:alkylated DNA repair dioxygenase AlkB
MNEVLQARHFLLLPQFISRQRAQALASSLSQHCSDTQAGGDNTVPEAPAAYDFLPFVRLLVEKIPQVEAAAEAQVLPTYSYARLYGHGQALRMHQDRDACELSLTLNLDADQAWPIWLQTPDGQSVSVRQQPGDALMYLGCQTPHWREPFEGRFCTQVFLHYVFAFGARAHAYFDKQRAR